MNIHVYECYLSNLSEDKFNKNLKTKEWSGKLYQNLDGNNILRFSDGIDSENIKSYKDLQKYFSYQNMYISVVINNDIRVDLMPTENYKLKQNLIKQIETLDPKHLILPVEGLHKKTNNELQDILNKLESYKNDVEFIIKRHEGYKSDIVSGYILWPLSIFIIPFILGLIIEHGFIGGVSFVALASFIYPVLLPLSFIFAFLIYPQIVHSIKFQAPSNNKHCDYPSLCSNFKYVYYDDIAKNLSIGHNELKKYALSTIAGSVISKIL